MKELEIKRAETVITLELTETEFNTILVQYGVANIDEAKETADRKGLKVLQNGEMHGLYNDLCKISEKIKR